jgi:hypothetical protein
MLMTTGRVVLMELYSVIIVSIAAYREEARDGLAV